MNKIWRRRQALASAWLPSGLPPSRPPCHVPFPASITPGEQVAKGSSGAGAGGGSSGLAPRSEDGWDAVAACTEGGGCHGMATVEEGMWGRLSCLLLLYSITLHWRFGAGTVCHPMGHACPGDGRVQQQGQGFGCTLQHGVLQRTWPQVVLLHLGSTEGHQEQPCVSVTTQAGLCSPRSLSQRSPQSCFVTQAELKP